MGPLKPAQEGQRIFSLTLRTMLLTSYLLGNLWSSWYFIGDLWGLADCLVLRDGELLSLYSAHPLVYSKDLVKNTKDTV